MHLDTGPKGDCPFRRTKLPCLSATHQHLCLQDPEEAGTSTTSAAREEQQRLEAQLQQTEGRLQLAELQLAATRADLQRAQASLKGAQQVGPCCCCESHASLSGLEVGLHKCRCIAQASVHVVRARVLHCIASYCLLAL